LLTNTVMDTQALPETLFRLIKTKKVRIVQTDSGVISITPLGEGSGLRGIAKSSGLTVEKLLEYGLKDKELEN